MTDSKDKKTTAGKAKTTATKTTQAAAKNTLTASTLPTAADLKDRFKAGSIPLQTDFADLIDMANTGAQAAGQASGQSGAGQGLTINSGLLEVKAGNGIEVSASGVSVDPNTVLPKGIITMFSGTRVPDGWLLCDGTHDTPNLIDRFIMGGNVADAGGKSSTAFSGDKNNKQATTTTTNSKTGVNVGVNNHTLTISEIPAHSHSSTYRVDSAVWQVNGGNNGQKYQGGGLISDRWVQFPISNTGGGNGHNHTASVNDSGHIHTVNVTPPYYILAFIMKS